MPTRRFLTTALAGLPLAACQFRPSPVLNLRLPGTIDTGGTFARGFDATEAEALVELCGNLNEQGAERKDFDTSRWTAVLPSSPLADGRQIGPWHNAWKLWRRVDEAETYAVVIRGTIGTTQSILQDIIAAPISALPVVIRAWDDGYLVFPLANTGGAEVHLGFAYGLAVLLFAEQGGIVRALRDIVPPGSRIYLTGHSQGAAIASLAHAFLHYAINEGDDRYGLHGRGHSLKSYVYAQPRPGNTRLAADFGRIAGGRGLAFVINNERDWVPRLPPDPTRDGAWAALPGDESGMVVSALNALTAVLQGAGAGRDVSRWISDRFTEPALQGWNRADERLDRAFRLAAAPGHPQPGSFDYALMGHAMPVRGHAGEGGLGDPLYQHHPATYRALIREQLRQAGTENS